MTKRRGNPNWGKPESIALAVPNITEFEQVAKQFRLKPNQYVRSLRLREWARNKMHSRYVPEALLKAWGFQTKSDI